MENEEQSVFAVVMAGGKGERFWPLSREERPKQLLNLFGETSLIEQTVARLTPMLPPERILIVTNRQYTERIRALLPQLPPENVVGEPAARDTAPCVALAAGIVEAMNGGRDAVMLLLPADHCIENGTALRGDLRKAAALAGTRDAVVTVGVKPDFPSPDYGYIECGEPIGGETGFGVRRFREKPDPRTAEEFLRAGNFLWNSGMFAWRISTIAAEMRKNAPQLADLAGRVAAAWGKPGFDDLLRREYADAPKISVDYAVMEKARQILVIPASFDWDDVGNWSALRNHIDPDAAGNTVKGDAELLDCRNCIVCSAGGRLIAGVGLEKLVVVDSGDVVFISPLTSVSKVKELLKEFRRKENLSGYL